MTGQYVVGIDTSVTSSWTVVYVVLYRYETLRDPGDVVKATLVWDQYPRWELLRATSNVYM